ncbi:hypothetical protein [Gracilibacillus dipsosauri]|uniref:Y-family DNA polymerase n=1 Tax=Gracilibacillus dipsosauri TaxID=178340 RepID=UPI003242FCC2
MTLDGTENLFGSTMNIARMIQEDIFEQFGIPCVVGIGDNKFLAKVVIRLLKFNLQNQETLNTGLFAVHN